MQIYAINNSQKQFSSGINNRKFKDIPTNKTGIGFQGGKEQALKTTTKKMTGLGSLILASLGIKNKHKLPKELRDNSYDIKTKQDEAGNINRIEYYNKNSGKLDRTIEYSEGYFVNENFGHEIVTEYIDGRPVRVRDYLATRKGKSKDLLTTSIYTYFDGGDEIKTLVHKTGNLGEISRHYTKNSKLESQKFTYYADGTFAQENKYINGDKERIYYQEQKVSSCCIEYADGTKSSIFYHHNGNPKKEEITDKNGNYKSTNYYELGQVASEEIKNADGSYEKKVYYQDGTLNVHTTKDKEGNSVYDSYYQNRTSTYHSYHRVGKADGSYQITNYFENGDISLKQNKDKDGNEEYIKYHSNKAEAVHRNIKSDGTYEIKEYTQDGKITKSETKDKDGIVATTDYRPNGNKWTTKTLRSNGTYQITNYGKDEKPISTVEYNKDGIVV